MEGPNRNYEEINHLHMQLRELRLKYGNQTVLLEKTENNLRQVSTEFRAYKEENANIGDQGDELKTAREQYEELLEETNRMRVELEKERFERAELEQRCEECKTKADQAESQNAHLKEVLENLQKSLVQVKSIACQYEEENKTLSEALDDLQLVEQELRETVHAKDKLLGTLESQAQEAGKQKSDMAAVNRETNRNRKQLLLLSENSNRIQTDLNNQLLQSNHLLTELKIEYEEHAETVRAEWESDNSSRVEAYNKLKKDYENLKMVQFEDKQRLLAEQRKIAKALQVQFEEYRQTAEFLFTTEASKLEEKLRYQTEKYEEEIKYLIKAKDHHFDAMMTAKDAKIMNLIEGSDLQTILIQHEQELEQVKRQHLDDLERVRLKSESIHREAVAALMKDIDSHQAVQQRLKANITNLEAQIQTADSVHQAHVQEVMDKERDHQKELERMQSTLSAAHEAREKLNKEKQDLRHRIVRLRFQAKGDADETLPNLVKRLSIETSTLKSKHLEVSGHLHSTLEHLKQLEQKHNLQTRTLAQLRVNYSNRMQEMQDTVQALSKALYSRVENKFGERAQEKNSRPSKKQPGELTFRESIGTLQRVLDGSHSNNWTMDDLSEESKPANNNKVSPRVKVRLPDKLKNMLSNDCTNVDRVEVMELAKGIAYLEKFQQVSSAYSQGTFKLPPGVANKVYSDVSYESSKNRPSGGAYEHANTLQLNGDVIGQRDEQWRQNSLYKTLDQEEARARTVAIAAQTTDFDCKVKQYTPSRPRTNTAMATSQSGPAQKSNTRKPAQKQHVPDKKKLILKT